MMTNPVWNERELISKRNEALWRSIRNFGDSSLEEAFKESCFALSKNTRIKRQFIESVNHAHANMRDKLKLLAAEAVT